MPGSVPLKENCIDVVGYGSNDEMGSFLLQGHIELFTSNKLREKEMANQSMKRLKLAKFALTKSYVSESLKQLVQNKFQAQKINKVEPIQNQQLPSIMAATQGTQRAFVSNRFTNEQI